MVASREIDRSYDVPCPRCAGRTTRHVLQGKAEVKERLLDGTMTFYCAWCDQSRAPTEAEQDHLFEWILGEDESAALGVTRKASEGHLPNILPRFEYEWPILIPDSIAVGDVVVCAEQHWFTYGRVTDDRGRVYLGSSTERLVACYLAAQHAGGRARVWFADVTGALTEYVYELN
jgi:hypothetical protein